jgi:hypothetical protein
VWRALVASFTCSVEVEFEEEVVEEIGKEETKHKFYIDFPAEFEAGTWRACKRCV